MPANCLPHSYPILLSQVTKAFQKNPASFQDTKYHAPTSHTLAFNSFLLCSEFVSIFAPQLLKASIVHRRVLHTCAKHVCIPTCSPSQDNIHIAIITLFSTSATKPLWPDQPSSNCSPIPAAHSCRPQCLSPLSPAMATPWPPHW